MGWHKEALERRSIWPYRVFENHLKMQVSGRRLLSGDPVGDAFDGRNWKYEKKSLNSSFLTWKLFEQEEPWDQLQLEITLSMQKAASLASTVFPSGDQPDCVYAIDTLCKSTRWRYARTAPYGSGDAILSLTVNRSDIAGTIIFSPFLLLWEHRPHAPKREAMVKGTRIATGFPFQIQADAPQVKPGRGIEILWTPFPVEVSDSLFDLIIEPPKPILKLNNEHPSLKIIIEDLSKTGNRARIRNALFSFIGTDVWTQLAEFATTTEKSGIDDDDPSTILSRKILKSLTKMLKCADSEILEAFEDHESKSMLRLRIQHHLKTLSNQDALITGVVAEDIQDFSL